MTAKFRNSFLGNAAFSGGLHLIVKLTWIIGLETAIQRAIGTEAYGQYFALFNLSVLFVSVLDPGLTNFFVRRVAAQPATITLYLGSILALKLLLSILYFVGLLVLGLVLQKDGVQLSGLMLLGLAQLFFSMGQFFRAAFAAKGRFKLESLFANLDKLLLIVLVIPLLLQWLPFGAFSANHYIVAQVLAGLLGCALTVAVLGIQGNRPTLQRSRKLVRTVLWKSGPYALLVLLMMGYVRLDGILLEFLHSPLQAGIYAGGFRFFDGFFQFSALFTTILLPVFARNTLANSAKAHTFYSSLWVLTTMATALALGVYFYGDYISSVLYREDSAAIAVILKILTISLIPLVWSLVSGAYLTAQGRLGFLNRVAFIVLIFSFFGNIIFVPAFGAEATAWIALFCHSFSAISLTVAVLQQLKLSGKGFFLNLFLFALIGSGGVVLSLSLTALPGLFVFIGFSGAVSLVLGYFHFRNYPGGIFPPV